MDIRAQVSMVFHLDKCIGCHTCSVACKNVWTDRPGAEYMWWNNVETKPGTGFPTLWEDQDHYKGGWKLTGGNGHAAASAGGCGSGCGSADSGKANDGWQPIKLELRSQNKLDSFVKLFYNPNQPGLEDYYEPWTYRYTDLFNAPEGDDQPTAIPVSQITGEPMAIEAGPNWDDDLSGSTLYAENDLNLEELSDEEREQLFEIERISMMYLPRICNHCANPSCVASCPSGALYKRGEDGIVLINQDVCKGWRACIPACPYKKIYYNWKTGKSEKCILCYPKLETGQIPNCFQSCVGRIRYLGVLLYDADRVADAMKVPDHALVESQRTVICDPYDEKIVALAKANGISDEFIRAAQLSPVYKYVMKWKIALPLHIEYRTMPMLFYVPPLLPVMGKIDTGIYENPVEQFFTSLEKSRLPIKYLARLFSAGNVSLVEYVMKKLMAVRYYRRSLDMADLDVVTVSRMMKEGSTTPEEAEAIFQLTALPTIDQRFVIPETQREEALEGSCNTELCKGSCGLGMNQNNLPERGL
ncbi:MAG: nitrate reductase / nitrite oxidoreductase, beta subunit [Cyanobacteriota bacterium erpe_2018_sw_21hr_WHONDRS-SW48-000092_B_bin.40]|nr:nitrate reductase / nitrite oxidoreductase, beta subunit [Cyanobacteriota bacterium erpe_2018_sw_21hr_WHONDRS-SW48-000092_B_bin.40]